jgi:hypothetical protein
VSDHEFRIEYQHERHERRYVPRSGCGMTGCGLIGAVALFWTLIVCGLLYFLLRHH